VHRLFFLDSAFLFRNKQTSTKTRRATKPNVWGISAGERSMMWAKLSSGRGDVASTSFETVMMNSQSGSIMTNTSHPSKQIPSVINGIADSLYHQTSSRLPWQTLPRKCLTVSPSPRLSSSLNKRWFHPVRLGNSGLKVSKIILGCMSYGTSDWAGWVLDEAEAAKHIKAACVAIRQCFSISDYHCHLQIWCWYQHIWYCQRKYSFRISPFFLPIW